MAGASEVRLVTHIVSPSPFRCKGVRVANGLDETIQDFMEEMRHGPGGRKGAERRAEIAHERELALIRTESHALVWTGTADELTATIAKWFEAGWIVAESLQDALQKASVHFRKPDGAAAIVPVTPPAAMPSPKVSRESFVKAILDAKGWSVLDWANESGVASATAHDYLAKKTKPYRSTRLKLAKSLGVSIQQLPS